MQPTPPSSESRQETWIVSSVAGAWADVRHAARRLWKTRGFTTVTLLTLALCIGANTAIFSMVYALMLKPLPFSQPERIVEIYNTFIKAGLNKVPSNVVQYLDYQEHATSYEKLGLWSLTQGLLGEDGAQERIFGARATPDLLELLGLHPVVGSFFTMENCRPAADKVVILAQSFWQTQYQEDPGVVGKKIRIDGEMLTVVGVAPRALEAFNARVRFVRPVSWTPESVNPAARYALGIQLFGRLKPGVTDQAALAEATAIERRFYDAAPPPSRDFVDRSGHKIAIGGVQLERVKPLQSALYLLQGGVICVLLIGCVNVANLLLARANGRQSEIAIRFALGATRWVIARQLLVESLLVTALGAVLGLGLASVALGAINHYIAQLMPDMLPFVLDQRMLGFTVAVSVLVGLFIGLLPVVHILRANLMELIHSQSRGASGGIGVRTVSSILIVGQVAFALILLAGAGLLIRSFANAVSVQPGFDPSHVVTGRIALPAALRTNDEVGKALQERLKAALAEIPGVTSVGLALATPFQGSLPINALSLAEDPLPPGSPQPSAYRVVVSPGYAETLRLTLLEGRFFTPADAVPNRPVYIIDETFAKKYFPGRSALGGRFTFGGRPEKDADWPTVIGVVKNVPHNGVEDRSGLPFIYQPLLGRSGGLTLFLRTERPATEILPVIREKLRTIDPAIPLFDTGSLQSFIDLSFNHRRSIMILLVSFALLALFLSAIGIYGVLAYDVSQRTREIGIRGAIGAGRGQIVGMILQQGLWKAVAGLVVGMIGAMLLSRSMGSLLFDVQPTDPFAYASVALLLLAVAALASYLPARRAAKIDPMVALRDE